MLNRANPLRLRRCAGFSLIEILVTVIIVTFGLLGLAGLQLKIQNAEMESYQRGQALLLLNDMVERMTANRANAAGYVSADAFGTGDSQPADCSGLAAGAARDQCEWSKALKGSAEASGTANVGAMIGARGCISEIQAADSTAGVCAPGIYEVQVAWQGMNDTVAPAETKACGEGQYGRETLRRVVSGRVTVGLTSCS